MLGYRRAGLQGRRATRAPGRRTLVAQSPLPPTTEISIEILRNQAVAFAGQTTLAELKREPQSLVDYLFRDNAFPQGCFLMTGTGIVPPSDFTLASADRIRITIPPIGTLENEVG